MADEDQATRAPESDAAEQSAIPGDSKVDQGSASLGEHCTTDRPTSSGAKPTGELTKFDDTEVYITKPADYPHSPSKLLLLLTGGTGVHSTNNQLQADKWATEGFLVVMPDQFAGDPAPTTNTSTSTTSPTLIEQVKLGFATVAKSFTIDMWLARHTPETVLPRLHKVLSAIREEFADAVANGGGVYAAGYCFGARYVLLHGSNLDEETARGDRAPESTAEEGMAKHGAAIKVGAIAHGTLISAQDFAKVEVPVGIVAVENDSLFPDDVREKGVKALRKRSVEVVEEVYKDVPHGFAVLGDYGEASIVEKQGQAFAQMVGWLKGH
nr:hypothetical protein B0A51_00671 [Rachicladosporium sp. CCFEE 5018]